MEPFIFYMEKIIQTMIPASLLEALNQPQTEESLNLAFDELFNLLPLINWSKVDSSKSSFCVSLLCPADFTQGVGRYFTDTLSRWLIPGKFLTIYSAHSLNFQFESSDKHSFFIHQVVLDNTDKSEVHIINNNLPKLAHEIKVNVTAVKHARRIISHRSLSPDQKRALIEESMTSLIDRPTKAVESNIFDHMHHFLIKLAGEDQEAKMKEGFVSLMEQKPSLFDRDIFNEIRHFILLFRDKFSAVRQLRHLGRIISYQYLFRKTLQRHIRNHPNERSLQLKLFQTQLTVKKTEKNVLSVLIGINILQENELFGERHILAAVESLHPDIKKVCDSFVIDSRSSDKIRVFYIEVEKEDGSSFSLDEMKELKLRLPRELKGKIENVIHPVLFSRNEEEVMRNIVLLSQELKFVHDLPQVYISFDTQVRERLSFTVILLRLLYQKLPPLKKVLELADTSLQCFDFEVKQTGFLRKRYPKEANVFRVELDKTPFLRKDFSLDLYKARLVVSSELSRVLGEFRDFNGGILSKEQEALLALKASLKGTKKSSEFLAENFFYSITPPVMRSILYTSHLHDLYLMMLKALDHTFSDAPFSIQTTYDGEYALIMIASPFATFKEPVCNALQKLSIDQLDLSYTYIDSYDIACLGMIVRCHEEAQNEEIVQEVQLTMTEAIPKISSKQAN